MKKLLILTLGAILCGAGCGASASDANASLESRAAAPAKAKDTGVTIPAGTLLQLKLTTAVSSETASVEDSVSAEFTDPVTIGGRTAIPAGAKVTGVVTAADGAGRVKGRARLALGFTSMTISNTRYQIQTAPVSQQADATKGEDATKIGIGAGAGAALGAILGGKKGAAEGAAVGGGAGTGVVLATKGQEVRLASGANVSTRLTAPLTVRVGR